MMQQFMPLLNQPNAKEQLNQIYNFFQYLMNFYDAQVATKCRELGESEEQKAVLPSGVIIKGSEKRAAGAGAQVSGSAGDAGPAAEGHRAARRGAAEPAREEPQFVAAARTAAGTAADLPAGLRDEREGARQAARAAQRRAAQEGQARRAAAAGPDGEGRGRRRLQEQEQAAAEPAGPARGQELAPSQGPGSPFY